MLQVARCIEIATSIRTYILSRTIHLRQTLLTEGHVLTLTSTQCISRQQDWYRPPVRAPGLALCLKPAERDECMAGRDGLPMGEWVRVEVKPRAQNAGGWGHVEAVKAVFYAENPLFRSETRRPGGPAHAKTRLETGSSWEIASATGQTTARSRRHDHDLHLLNTKIPTTPAHFRSPPTRPPLPIPKLQPSKPFVLVSGPALHSL